MLTTVFFDIDDTLLDFRASERAAFSDLLNAYRIQPEERLLERYSEINKEHWKRYEVGQITKEQVLHHRFEEFFAEIGVAVSADAVQRYYEKRLSSYAFLIAGAIPLLETLKLRYRLCSVSNGLTAVQMPRLGASGLLPYFEKVFLSEQIGAAKPSKRFFDACFAAIPDIKRAETVIIGDSVSSDMKGGIAAGIHTVWYRPKREGIMPKIGIEHTVRTLDEIPSLLETI